MNNNSIITGSGITGNGINSIGNDYQSFKRGVLNTNFFRKEVELSEITIVSDEKISYKGVEMDMTQDAFKDLVKLLGLTQGVVKTFENILSKEAKTKIITLMKSAHATIEKKHKICMLVTSNAVVCGFLRSIKEAVLSNNSFFQLFEEIMQIHSGMEIKTMALTKQGNVEITVVNRNWQFDIAGLKDEYFHSGMTFINMPDRTIINPFNERLVCTNGMVTQAKGMSLELLNSDATSINGFFDAVRNIKNMDYFQNEFKRRAMIMMKTVASYHEMKSVHNSIMNQVNFHHMTESDALMARTTIERFVPVSYVESEYMKNKVYLEEMDKKIWHQAKTNQTVWELVNALTDISSHSDRYMLPLVNGTASVFQMQKMAGELSFKSPLDLEAVLPNIF